MSRKLGNGCCSILNGCGSTSVPFVKARETCIAVSELGEMELRCECYTNGWADTQKELVSYIPF